jgi:hypothetical protein
MEEKSFNFYSGENGSRENNVDSSQVKSSSAQDRPIGEYGLKKGEIQHMVIFNLRYERGLVMANKFLTDARRILSVIPVVKNFQVLSQVSVKNDYDYGFSMIFDNKEAYTTYNNYPEHVAFVENRWEKEVTRFLEIDLEI